MARATATADLDQALGQSGRDRVVGLNTPGWIRGTVSSGRITKVGLWLTLLTLILSVAAANTGNNSLYLVIAATTSLLIVAWAVARANVMGHDFKIIVPDEIYAGSPAVLKYEVRRRARGVSTELLVLIEGSRSGTLLRRLRGLPSWYSRLLGWAKQGSDTAVVESSDSEESVAEGGDGVSAAHRRVFRGDQEVLYLRRGVHRVGQAKALSLFPMGFFRRQVIFRSVQEVIVLPEIFSGLRTEQEAAPRGWREVGAQTGRSEDLHSLRDWRQGDDPRSIHWKQSARNARLIYQERSEDEDRRVSILVDNVVPEAVSVEDNRFERLISEAATACVEYLESGYEVELVLRDGTIGYAAGAWQRRRLLEALALLQSQVASPESAESHRALEAWSGRPEEGAHVLRFSLSQASVSSADGCNLRA